MKVVVMVMDIHIHIFYSNSCYGNIHAVARVMQMQIEHSFKLLRNNVWFSLNNAIIKLIHIFSKLQYLD